MTQIYNSDKPITEKEQDYFNRYKFCKRIAETIIHRNNDEGLVLGLYGIWGEGKSSILNMIEKELTIDDILIVKFNPWRFKDEDSLILNFLNNLSERLEVELNTKKEKFGEFLKKYGTSIGIGILNLDLSKIGGNLSDTQLEELKNRVNVFLKASNKKIVIVIDDIDRLDKQELFSLFKLIKLTGDFNKTYYILSFDDEMVASAIGERYAEGNIKSGYNFLEKIIQVPLRIPQALSKDLLNYTFELLNNLLKENNISLGESEEQNLGYLISQNLLLRIKTPRLAIRYSNSLSFLFPLMNGEVNLSDLMLFEGIKIFYPSHYDYIKNSPENFIETYYNIFDRNKNEEKIKDFKDKLEKLNEELSKTEQKAILRLIKHLFPITKEALENRSFNNRDNCWEKEKRIVSSKYFYRYFIYSVPQDDISDVYFKEYIENINYKTFEEAQKETTDIIENVSAIEYITKINILSETLDWEVKKTISKLISLHQEKFEGVKGGTFLNLINPKSQAATCISLLLLSHEDYSDRLEFAKYLIIEMPFEFSTELVHWFNVGNLEEDKAISNSDIIQLREILLDRALKDCIENETNIFERYENYIFRLLETWHETNETGLKNYITVLTENNPKFIEKIIWSLTSLIYSSSNPQPYKIDFARETFSNLKKYYDTDKILKLIYESFEKEIEKDVVIFTDRDEGQTSLNAMRQFIYWYNLDKNTDE